ncbi:hypothetical protein [Brevundimonas sp.]|uniref:hypothetical protein n=1 Tax=Brevundimonas sp. TaxID=1871086 RepID=UPI0035B0557F
MSDPDTSKKAAQVEPSRFASELKAEAKSSDNPAPGQTPNEGMNPTPNGSIAPSGAFDAEGQRPVLERSRKAR